MPTGKECEITLCLSDGSVIKGPYDLHEIKTFIEDHKEEYARMHHAEKKAYYHGENGFSYQCGYCGMPIDEKDHYCRWCGAKLDLEEEDDGKE